MGQDNDWCEVDFGDRMHLYKPAEIATWPGGEDYGRAGKFGMTVPGSSEVVLVGELSDLNTMLLDALHSVFRANGIDPPSPCPGCGDPVGPCDETCDDPGCDRPWDCCSHEGCQQDVDPVPSTFAQVLRTDVRPVAAAFDVEAGLVQLRRWMIEHGYCSPREAEEDSDCTCGDGVGPGCVVHDCTCLRDESHPCRVHDEAPA